jgi:glycosyltransferase involved in cell wall biosynthesis
VIKADVAFIGGIFPKEIQKKIFEKSKNIDFAANALQWKFINGLDANLEEPVKIINSVYVGSFPKICKMLFIKTFKFRHIENSNDINAGFINLPYFKHCSRYISMKSHLKKWAESNNKNKKIVIAYAMTPVFVFSLKYLKKINPGIITCLIVPDLPQYMSLSNKTRLLYKFLKNISINKMNKSMKYIDKFVLLTRQMADFLNIEQNKFIVIEGIAEPLSSDNKEKESDDINLKTILYSGTINERYGIMNLVNAFKDIAGDDYRLIICGSGDSRERIIKEAEKDPRIEYKGLVERDEVLRLQKNATVLVNPRQDNEEFTKYSFPSKILEYMSSGVPVIAYKLRGMPDEYDNYLNYVKDNTVVSLKDKIMEICEKSKGELQEIGLKAKDFVNREKNGIIQTKRLLEFAVN